MKTWSEIIEAVKNGAAVVLEMAKGIDEQESYLEKGMRCRIVSVTGEHDHDGVACLNVDMAPFRELNQRLESPNYFDASRIPCLTATQAGQYPADHSETIYVDVEGSIEALAQVIPDANTAVYNRYLTEKGASGIQISYIKWLEDELLRRS